jgi:hypothetical protein
MPQKLQPLELHASLLTRGVHGMTTKELEYQGRKLIARQYAKGWQIEIRPRKAGPIKHTMIFRELSDAIDEAKKIVDTNR